MSTNNLVNQAYPTARDMCKLDVHRHLEAPLPNSLLLSQSSTLGKGGGSSRMKKGEGEVVGEDLCCCQGVGRAT
jgi:hypothetical protein